MTATDPTTAPGPIRYGDGLAVLVVDTADGGSVVRLHDGSGDTVLRLGEDVGRAAAVNRAVAALPAEVGLVAVAAPAITWADGALDALCAAAARHPRAGVLAPRVRDGHGAAVPSTHPLPRPGSGLLSGLLTVLGGRPWPPPAAADPVDEAVVGWSSAPALLLCRTALDSVDGFDPRYPGALPGVDLADLDLCDRLAAAGWLTVHVPSATVVSPSVSGPPTRPDASAARRYLADRSPRPVRALLPVAVR